MNNNSENKSTKQQLNLSEEMLFCSQLFLKVKDKELYCMKYDGTDCAFVSLNNQRVIFRKCNLKLIMKAEMLKIFQGRIDNRQQKSNCFGLYVGVSVVYCLNKRCLQGFKPHWIKIQSCIASLSCVLCQIASTLPLTICCVLIFCI